MAESSAKVVIKGDAKHLVNEAKKGEAAIDKIGTRSKYLGAALRDANKELAGMAIKASIVVRTLNALGDAYEKLRTEKSTASKTVGEANVRAQLAGQRLGLSGSQSQSILGGSGTASLGDRAGFLEDLAGEKNLTADPATIARAAALQRTGLYSNEEVKAALRSGTLDRLESQDRRGALTGSARASYDTSVLERGAEITGANLRADAGNATRADDARFALSRANLSERSPGQAYAREVLGGATSAVGGDKLLDALDRFQTSGDRWFDYTNIKPRIGEDAK